MSMPDSNYKNLASAVIPTAGTTSDSSVVISATDGATFPSAPFYATIMPATGLANATNSEIVKVTAVATAGANTTFTVTRAQRNTSAISWSANGAIICHTVYTEDVAPLKDAAFIGSVLSTPSSVAYVATDNIQDGAVTSQKIDWTTLLKTVTASTSSAVRTAMYFGDGTMITHSKYNDTWSCSTTWGALYRGTNADSYSLAPFGELDFISAPTMSVTVLATSNASFITGSWENATATIVNNRYAIPIGSIAIVRPTTSGSVPVQLQVIAIGRWK